MNFFLVFVTINYKPGLHPKLCAIAICKIFITGLLFAKIVNDL